MNLHLFQYVVVATTHLCLALVALLFDYDMLIAILEFVNAAAYASLARDSGGRVNKNDAPSAPARDDPNSER